MAEQTWQGDTFRPGQLKEVTYHQQYQRQHLRENWEPVGYERYQYQRALQQEMPVLGGASDPLLGSTARYKPASSCIDTLDCTCGRHT